jgi:hypothetical protein
MGQPSHFLLCDLDSMLGRRAGRQQGHPYANTIVFTRRLNIEDSADLVGRRGIDPIRQSKVRLGEIRGDQSSLGQAGSAKTGGDHGFDVDNSCRFSGAVPSLEERSSGSLFLDVFTGMPGSC